MVREVGADRLRLGDGSWRNGHFCSPDVHLGRPGCGARLAASPRPGAGEARGKYSSGGLTPSPLWKRMGRIWRA
jgi:hypothetical protein